MWVACKLWGVNVPCGWTLTNEKRESIDAFFFLFAAGLAVWRSSSFIRLSWRHSANLSFQLIRKLWLAWWHTVLCLPYSPFLPCSCVAWIAFSTKCYVSYELFLKICFLGTLGSFFSERDNCLLGGITGKSQWYNVMSTRVVYRSWGYKWGTLISGWLRMG